MTQRVSSDLPILLKGAACLSQQPYPDIVHDARSHTWLQLAHSSFGICLLEAVDLQSGNRPHQVSF